MSRRYEWLEDGAEVITDPEEIREMTDGWGTPPEPGEIVLVLGNPYATAAVLDGTPDQIIATLQEYIDVVNANRPPVVVDGV